MTETTDYRPIACARYSELELAILKHHWLRLRWHGEDGLDHVGLLQPLDLETRAGEEFLIAEDPAGGRERVRLDRIAEFTVEERT